MHTAQILLAVVLVTASATLARSQEIAPLTPADFQRLGKETLLQI